jgi:iron-sulfur cluster insertion protein
MEPEFFITNAAERKIIEILKTESKDSYFRISVQGGGCSGFQYNFLVDNTLTDDDQVFGKENSKVVIDLISLNFIKGSSLDYLQEMSGEKFVIANPNAAASCGCGNSFSV